MLLWPDRCWLRSKATLQTSQRRRRRPAAPRPLRWQRGAPDSDLTGLADPSEDWPAASPRDAAAADRARNASVAHDNNPTYTAPECRKTSVALRSVSLKLGLHEIHETYEIH